MGDVIKSDDAAGSGRVWQIDALRGVAMVLMTVFHALVDIRDFFAFADVRYYEPPLVFIGRSSAILFMFVSGISCRFSKNNVRRGAKVLLCGMAVTAATYFGFALFFGSSELYIRFGILHFLGSAMIITGLFDSLVKNEKTRQIAMWIASPASLIAGRAFSQLRAGTPLLLIFGIAPAGFVSYDYYPIFPWIGIFFAGYAIGRIVVNNRQRLAAMKKSGAASAFCSLGRISLVYYLLHQPALIAVFFAFDFLFRVALNL